MVLYLFDWKDFIDHYVSTPLIVKISVPQRSILGPILFSVYINELGKGVEKANLHFYADYIYYTMAPSLKVATDSIECFSEIIFRLLLITKN